MYAEIGHVRLKCLDAMAKGVSSTGGEGNTCLREGELLRMTPQIQLCWCRDRGQSGLSPEPYSQDEAERVAAQLMDDAPPNVPSNGKRRGSFKGLFGFKGEPMHLCMPP